MNKLDYEKTVSEEALIRLFEAPAQAHDVTLAQFRKSGVSYGFQYILALLYNGISAHQHICGFGVFRIIPSKVNGSLQGVSVNDKRLGFQQKLKASVLFRTAEDSADTDDCSAELSRPVGEISVFRLKLRFQILSIRTLFRYGFLYIPTFQIRV